MKTPVLTTVLTCAVVLEPRAATFLSTGRSPKRRSSLQPSASNMSYSYLKCKLNSQECTVDSLKIGKELSQQSVLFFGSSIDIFALNYFCSAANASVVGFSRRDGMNHLSGNFAYCTVRGLNLAYSFQPGASGPPYDPWCEQVLHRNCTDVTPEQLIQQSVEHSVKAFGSQPSAIVVDSSLWDAASWWRQAGKPHEPYVAPRERVSRWCNADFPQLMEKVQDASPRSKVAFRTAPRIKFAEGYGHSQDNIEAINACFHAKESQSTSDRGMEKFKMVDLSGLVEKLLGSDPAAFSTLYEDSFHPGRLVSMQYIDQVLQWVHSFQTPKAS